MNPTNPTSLATIIDVKGPLALFHATTVYGRALAALVPLLARHERFVLAIRSELGRRERTVTITPPLLLPSAPLGRRTISAAERLARELEAAGCSVERDPSSIESGTTLLFSDLVVAGWRVELVGFSTESYLAHKLASYRAAGVRQILLAVDGERSQPAPPDDHALPDDKALPDDNALHGKARPDDNAPPDDSAILRYRKRVDVDVVLERLGLSRRPPYRSPAVSAPPASRAP